MRIDKLGPPEYRHPDIDCDFYFVLTRAEAAAISDPATMGAIMAALIAASGPAAPFAVAAASLIGNYIQLIGPHTGPNGCSVKMTVRNGLNGQMQCSYFIAEPV